MKSEFAGARSLKVVQTVCTAVASTSSDAINNAADITRASSSSIIFSSVAALSFRTQALLQSIEFYPWSILGEVQLSLALATRPQRLCTASDTGVASQIWSGFLLVVSRLLIADYRLSGPIIRVAPNEVSVNDISFHNTVLYNQGPKFMKVYQRRIRTDKN
jgi:hypothetical protein